MSKTTRVNCAVGSVIQNDRRFTAAKNADRVGEYMLGLERQLTAMELHKEWIEEYENAMRA